jgi:hypothetical protein
VKPGAPWSVKGVDPAAREAAKAAAAAAGMSLGAWLNHMIEVAKEPAKPAAAPEPPPAAEPPMPLNGAATPATSPVPLQNATRELLARLATSEKRIASVVLPMRDNLVALERKVRDLEAEIAGLRADAAQTTIVAPPPPEPQPEPNPEPAPQPRPIEPPPVHPAFIDLAEGSAADTSNLHRIVIGAVALIALIALAVVAWLLLREVEPVRPVAQAVTPRVPQAVLEQAATPRPQPAPAATTPPAATPAPAPDSASDHVRALRDAAGQGVASAQYSLGLMYYEGNGVAKDVAEAARWFQRAADQGHANAQFVLSSMLDQGIGVGRDGGQAMSWLAAAAEQSHVPAMFALGSMYSREGPGRDFVQARKWFERAAQQGHAAAMYNLATFAEKGYGQRVDERAAYRWFALAARQGDRAAQTKRAELAARLGSAETTAIDAELDRVRPAAPGATAAATPLGRDGVQKIQALLIKLNFDAGKADGVAGDKTRRAIQEFQRMAGLPPDGIPSAVLLQELERLSIAR